jgi:hypothetical protein
VLGDIRDRTAILSAQAQSLDHPQSKEHERGGQTDLVVGREQTDAAGADPHAGQGNEEGVLSTDAVAHPPKKKSAQRADEESGREQRNRTEQGCDRVRLLKEFDRQDSGQAPENVEVVPFDDISH